MHPRNKHTGRYDLEKLAKSSPELTAHITPNPLNQPTVDFSDPAAVKALNRALLKEYYHVAAWDIPEGYLCPPIPGRADYIHHAADLLAEGGDIPRGPNVRVLDIGVGANCIYPLIGLSEYGWRFVGSETDPVALDSARRIVESQEDLRKGIELRLQLSASRIYNGVLQESDRFDLSLCNPPFHGSAQEVEAGSKRKWKNLGHGDSAKKNFGGQATELWYPGGEDAFVRLMIKESAQAAKHVLWFTTIVSKEANLPGFEKALKKAGCLQIRNLDMSVGQKKSRILAWTFTDAAGLQRRRSSRG